MKWFRHFSNVRSSGKLNGLIDAMGVEGYGRYWMLFELLNEKFDGAQTNIHLHERELISSLLLRYPRTLRDHLGTMSGLGLFQLKVSGKFYEIDCPMLKELQDKDSKYNRKKRVPVVAECEEKNKKKNEIKIITPTVPFSESIETEFVREEFNPANFLDAKKILSDVSTQENLKVFTPDEVVDVWNRIMGPRGFNLASGLGGTHLANCLESLKFLKDEAAWINLFEVAFASAYLRGLNDRGWTVTFRWLLNYDNAQKVLDGDFNDGAGVKVLFASMKSGETA